MAASAGGVRNRNARVLGKQLVERQAAAAGLLRPTDARPARLAEDLLPGEALVDEGVLVIEPPSEGSELQSGDVLLELDGNEVTNAREAMKTLAMSGETIDARVLRNGKKRKVSIDCSQLSASDHMALSIDPGIIRIRRGIDGDDDVDVRIVVDEEVVVDQKGSGGKAADDKAGG